jgi:hypothetical protein
MHRFPLTTAALALAVGVLLVALIGHVNLIAMPARFLDRIEQSEIDDIVTAVALVLVALTADGIGAARRARRARRLENERVRVVKVTMRTVQDIVNNCLNELQLLRFEAEGHVAPETLAQFDVTISQTAAKLTALGDLEAYTEHQLVVGMGLGGGPGPG